MDFIDELKQFSTKAKKLKDRISTEEATKTSLIMPFFQLLGYDVFDPDEFLPEFIADVGLKKGEKVDYAIMKNDEPLILIEAKTCSEFYLHKHGNQLFRYFGTTKAKFGILTNGISYLFYTDLDEQNIMDTKPFFEFNLLEIKENKVNELKKFKKENLDVDTIMSSASELKYTGEIKELMTKLLDNPTDDFVHFILGEIYSGRRTQNMIDKFRYIVKKSLNEYINELMNERIKNAIEKQSSSSQEDEASSENDNDNNQSDDSNKIVTTIEELESFFIIKTILKDYIDPEKITYKDTQSYFSILLENNTWKWICRVYIKESIKYLTIPDENKKEIKYEIDDIQNIYNHKDDLIESLRRYI
ncbi:type I restriction endonuclease [Sporosalibacterium faouarense]|uniref:type I restriction endonuclease n=1 Tax=Sporosalibacterium faouarense TaxID=516123 RepID=UPI00192C91A9|nr:type I restriction endonuclease [Sporosalibacterium faouarense]